VLAPFVLAISFIIPLAMTSHRCLITVAHKTGFRPTVFLPKIHLQLPCIIFLKIWFKLRPTLIFLTSEEVLAPQSNFFIDLESIGDDPQSKVVIYPPSTHDPRSTRYVNMYLHSKSMTVDSGSPALRSFKSQLSAFPRMTIFQSGRPNDTCPQQSNGSDEL